MAGNISTTLATRLLNAMLRNIPYSGPTVAHLALYTTNPTDADVGTEVPTTSGGQPTGYARLPVTFTDPVVAGGRECANDTVEEFPECLIAWGLITHCGLRTHAAAGVGDTLLAHAGLAVPKDIGVADILRFKAGKLTVGFAASA